LLINQVIGLCKTIPNYPSTLRELGYNVEWIEPNLINSDGELSNPDIILTSKKLHHSLIVECKGGCGAIDIKQLTKYSKINTDSIKDHVDVPDPRRLTFDICFSVTPKSKGNIVKLMKDSSLIYPTLIFSEKIEKVNKFNKKEVENKFSSKIDGAEKPPTQFYPFGDEDDSSLIAVNILPILLSLSLKRRNDESIEITTDELLEGAHPLWKDFSDSKKKKLRGKVENILRQLRQSDLNEFLSKVKGKPMWQITKSLNAFSDKCNEIIEKLSTQKTLGEY